MQPEQLLFLPGAGGRAEFWRPVADRVAYPSIRQLLGWPGFGALPADPGVRGLADLVRVVTHQIDRPTALIAQSMGGIIALQAALDRPERVTHLVLAVTSGGIDLSGIAVADWRPAFFAANPDAPRWFGACSDDISASLDALRIPALLLWGDADPISPVAVGHRLQGLLRGSRLQVFAGADHDLAISHATQVASAIDAHLA